ncbi:unnamed protein product [Rotaria sp. Silwood1]|nr:unnamed protein product [Rotaria sp. Silwood1]
MPVFSEINIEKIEWKNIQHCCTFVEDDMISQDGLYNDFNHIKSKYIVLREKYDGITKQVQSFILSNLGTSKRAEAPLHDEDSAHDDDGCNATNDSDSGSNDDDERNAKYHKEQKENLWIRSDYLWTYLLDDERVPNLQKLVKFVFSIPVSNGYCETVFSHMKYLWNHNRNRMKQNLVGAEAREIACNVLAPALTYSIILALRDVAFFSIAYYSPNKGNVILKQIRLRWLSLLPSIRRFIVVHPVAKSYFLNLEHNECPNLLLEFFSSNENSYLYFETNQSISLPFQIDECSLYFLANILPEVQAANLSLQCEYTTDGSFSCKVGQLLKNVQSSSQVNDFKKLFRSFIHSVIDYIEKYYNSSASLYQSMPIFSEINIEKIEWKNIQHCCTFVEDDMISQDGLYNDFNHIKSKYIVLREKYDGITKQVQSFILSNLGTSKRAEAPLHDEDSAHDDGCNATNDFDSDSNDDDEHNAKCHKEQKENLSIRSDYLWAYLLDGERVPNLQKLVQFVFAIPVSNGYCETVFSHMKYLWNNNRNRMKQNLVRAEEKIKMNTNCTSTAFYDHLLNKSDLLKQIRSSNK